MEGADPLGQRVDEGEVVVVEADYPELEPLENLFSFFFPTRDRTEKKIKKGLEDTRGGRQNKDRRRSRDQMRMQHTKCVERPIVDMIGYLPKE